MVGKVPGINEALPDVSSGSGCYTAALVDMEHNNLNSLTTTLRSVELNS